MSGNDLKSPQHLLVMQSHRKPRISRASRPIPTPLPPTLVRLPPQVRNLIIGPNGYLLMICQRLSSHSPATRKHLPIIAGCHTMTEETHRSKCFGEHVPDARARLGDWEKLLEMYVPSLGVEKKLANISSTPENSSSGLLVRLYLREEDNRARILCKWRSRYGGTRYSTLPLNTLHIYREGPALLLCRRIFDSYKVEMWARLKFPSMESKRSLRDDMIPA